jgi:rubrerythrin
MGGIDSIGEALEFAIAREVDASEFYMELAGRMENPAMRVLFEGLAREELEHKAKLELEVMKEGIVARTVGRIPHVKVTASDYLLEDEIKADMGLKEALIMGIEKERRSFRFYVRLSGIADEEALVETLISLAEEEARHLVRFENEYDRLVSSEK